MPFKKINHALTVILQMAVSTFSIMIVEMNNSRTYYLNKPQIIVIILSQIKNIFSFQVSS